MSSGFPSVRSRSARVFTSRALPTMSSFERLQPARRSRASVAMSRRRVIAAHSTAPRLYCALGPRRLAWPRTRPFQGRDRGFESRRGHHYLLGDREMRHGFRVIDSDTHVNPSMDVLLRYADTPLRDRLDDLAPYLRKVTVNPGHGDAEDMSESTIMSIKQLRYSRVAGAKPSPPTGPEGDRGFLSARTRMVTRLPITARVAEDNARGRLADMDTEGRDIDFIIPGPWAYGAPSLAPHLTRGLVDAYHRYMAEYCGAD